jgi:hypothetical protein
MNEETKLREEINKGHQAKELLENPLLADALKALEEDTIKKLKEAPVRDYEGQHELFLMLKLIEKFEHDLKRHIQTGRLASISLTDLLNRAKKIINF